MPNSSAGLSSSARPQEENQKFVGGALRVTQAVMAASPWLVAGCVLPPCIVWELREGGYGLGVSLNFPVEL